MLVACGGITPIQMLTEQTEEGTQLDRTTDGGNLTKDYAEESEPSALLEARDLELFTSLPDRDINDNLQHGEDTSAADLGLRDLGTDDMPTELALDLEQNRDTSRCLEPTQSALQRVAKWQSLTLNALPMAQQIDPCAVNGYRMLAAATAKIQVDISDLPPQANIKLLIYNAKSANFVAKDPPLAQSTNNAQTWISTVFTADISGEFSLVLESSAPHTIHFRVQAFCVQNCHLQATRFPIVLLHGFAGTDKYFGIIDYFYQVKPWLEKHGFAVFTPDVQPIANSTKRVQTLKQKIDEILKQTGTRKLNFIAHSQGGVDTRLLIHEHRYAPYIATLTTISTPHRGIPIPDLLVPPSQELGEENMKQYNQKYPDDPNVEYFSWAGVTCSRLDQACRKKYDDEEVNPLLAATYHTLKQMRGDNDGLVPVSSAKWGTFLGELPADHWDQIGQIAAQNNKPFVHKDFYLKEALRLSKLDF
jgi:triacylglycerol lipase